MSNTRSPYDRDRAEPSSMPPVELPDRLDGIQCAAPGCPRRARLNRIFCGRHWQMVPQPEQLVLRKILFKWARRKSGELKSEYQAALEAALTAILAQEKEFIDERQVQAFVERMQVVAQVTITIRQLPVAEMHKQLMTSAGDLAEEHPDAYAAKEKDIARDAGVLRILGEAKQKLEAWLAPPALPVPAEVQPPAAESAADDCKAAAVDGIDDAHRCAVCRVAYVDSDNGYDTCAKCAAGV